MLFSTSSQGVGRVTGMTFGSVSSSGFISLAIMTSTQLTLVQVSTSKTTLELLHTAKLLLNGCHPAHSPETASMVVSLGSQVYNTEAFAIVYRPKSSDVAYTPASQKTTNDSPDAFNQEAAAITNNSNSFFSPTLTIRNLVSTENECSDTLIQEVNVDEGNKLIEKTVSATMKELRKPHLDDSVRIEEEASKLITPEKIRQISEQRIVATQPVVPAVDASESVLSPLMGLTLADGETTRDESALMTSLLHIQAQTPKDTNLDSTAHMILVRVEYVGEESQIKISPSALLFPQQMAGLEVMSIVPMPERPSESLKSPAARGHITFDDLMFSPSPGKLMSPAGADSALEISNMSIVCKSADSKKLYCFVLSTRDRKQLVIESEACIDLDLSQSFKVPVKALSIKGMCLDEVSVASKGGRLVCCNKIRIVASASIDESNEEREAPKPINLSLQEDSTVLILGVTCSLPLGMNRSNVPFETPAPDKRLVSQEHDTGIENNTLHAILNKLSSFETQVYRRMDSMEAAIRANTERIEELETTLLRGHDQASF